MICVRPLAVRTGFTQEISPYAFWPGPFWREHNCFYLSTVTKLATFSRHLLYRWTGRNHGAMR